MKGALASGLAVAILVIGVCPPSGAGEAGDRAAIAAFDACVAEVEEATIASTFHHCTGPLAAHCGASETAAEAARCIEEARAGVEARIEEEAAALAAAGNGRREETERLLATARGGGAASCAVMASRDASDGVAVGQRAVNGAFCELVASGDALALLLRLGEGT